MSENNQRILLASFTVFVVVFWGIPLIRLSYQAGLTGLPSGPPGTGLLSAPVLSYGQSFLLALGMAVLLTKLLERVTLRLRSVLVGIVLLASLLAGSYHGARRAGESRTVFWVGKNTVDHETVALLFADGYGGLVTRKVDLTTRQLLPNVIAFPRAAAVPAWQQMELKR